MTKLERRHARSGQATIMVTFGIVFLMGCLGLVIEVGYGYFLKQTAQAVADSAALAAATAAKASGGTCNATVLCQSNYTCPANPTNTDNFGVGCLYAKQNAAGAGQVVTLSSGTGTVGGVSANYWVTATVSQPMPPLFSRVLGVSSLSAGASATGGVVGSGGAGGCIYVLDTISSQALNISGSGVIKSDCGIYINSSSSTAMNASGGSQSTASVVKIVGGYNMSGGSTITPTPTTGVAPAADPLASLPAPSFGGCNFTNKSVSAIPATLSPGVYCNGITISGGANVTFTPGTYILNGGGLSVSASTVTGNGVFFYNTSSGYSFSPIIFSGNTGSTLTAPTSGVYKGILMFQDRNIASSATTVFSGATASSLSGSLYFPTAKLNFSGGTTTSPLTMAMICKDLVVSGTAYLAKDTTGALTGMGSSGSFLIQ